MANHELPGRKNIRLHEFEGRTIIRKGLSADAVAQGATTIHLEREASLQTTAVGVMSNARHGFVPSVELVENCELQIPFVSAIAHEELFASVDQLGEFSRLAGSALAELHTLGRSTTLRLSSAIREECPAEPLQEARINFVSEQYLELAARLHKEGLFTALSRIDDLDETRTFIHGDYKYDNLLLSDGRIGIIDWECAGFGRVSSDIGAFSASLLCESFKRACDMGGGDLDSRLEVLQHQLSVTWDCIEMFVRTYRSRVDDELLVPAPALCLATARALLCRAGGYVARTGNLDRLTSCLVRASRSLSMAPGPIARRFA